MKKPVLKLSNVLIVTSAAVLLAVMIRILSQPPAASPTGPGWVDASAGSLQATLAVSTNPTEQAFIQGKLDILNRIQATSAGSLQNVPEKPSSTCAVRPTDLPAPKHNPGVEPFPPELYENLQATLNSRWQGEINGQWVTVLAGIQSGEAPQAALWLTVENTADSGVFPAAGASGALHIVSADRARLTLRDDAGAAFYFDAAARAYLVSPDDILPTVAPQPAFTPAGEVCPP